MLYKGKMNGFYIECKSFHNWIYTSTTNELYELLFNCSQFLSLMQMCYKLARGGQLTNQTTTSRIVTSQNYFINSLELEKQDFRPVDISLQKWTAPQITTDQNKKISRNIQQKCHKSQKYAEICSPYLQKPAADVLYMKSYFLTF